LKCAHYQNSAVILGRKGADKLLGKGQMIFDSYVDRDKRLQGSFITETGMKKLLDEIEKTYVQQNKYYFNFNEMKLTLAFMESGESILVNPKTSRPNSEDEKLLDAIMWSLSQNQIANSRLQDYLKIGIIDRIEY
jgi:DNA segregation ATPase FtsK/SpoIIIE-like protein